MAGTDVNLDFLTKEEKEALLSKKMDMIRQRNKALTERHKLIEDDKKKAEAAGQAVQPHVDSQNLPAEGGIKSRGRGRGTPHHKEQHKIRPKSHGDFRDTSSYAYEPIVDTSDLASYKHDFKGKGRGGHSRQDHERDMNSNTPKNKRRPPPKEEGLSTQNTFEYEPIVDLSDLDKRFGRLSAHQGSTSPQNHVSDPSQCQMPPYPSPDPPALPAE